MPQTGVRKSARSTRQRLRSPGRPPVGRREDRVQFWAAIASGLYPEAAVAAPTLPRPIPAKPQWGRACPACACLAATRSTAGPLSAAAVRWA